MPARKRVVVFATEPVTGRIGGLGIRQLETARTLSRHYKVRLLTPFAVEKHRERFPIERIVYEQPSSFEEHVRWANVVCSISLSVLPVIRRYGKPLAVDLLVPEYFENLEGMPLDRFHSQEKCDRFANSISRLTRLLTAGDFFLCPNERVRDYYLGMLASLGKLRPHDYPDDPQFRSLIDVSQFGLPRRRPKSGKTLFRGKLPGIRPDDFLIVWGGSLANWFDPLTAVRAMARLKQRLPRAKLVFTGNKHPMWGKLPRAWQEVVDLATRHGILDKSVFLHSDWVPYEHREYYLSEADAGIATFHDHIENHFSFRIRVVDYIWGELPVLTNPGNTQSELIAREQLGRVVPFGDDRALAKAIIELAENPGTVRAIRKNLARVRKQFYWERVLEPLVRFCAQPGRSASLFEHQGIPNHRKANSFSYRPEQLLASRPEHPYLSAVKTRQALNAGRRVEARDALQDYFDQFGIGLESHLFRQPWFGLDTEVTFEEILDLFPKHPHALLMQAQLEMDGHRLEIAAKLIDEEFATVGETCEALFARGLLQLKQHRYRKALTDLEAVAETLSGHLAFQLPVADALAKLKRTRQARGLYVRIWSRSRIGPHAGEEWIRARAAVGIARLDADRRPELETLNRYFRRDATNEMLAQIIAERVEAEGRRLMERGERTVARKFFNQAWKRNGKTAGEGWIRVVAALALARLDADRRPEIDTLHHFLEQDPKNERLAYAIASSLDKQGRKPEARSLFARFTTTFTEKSMLGSAWYRLALLSPKSQQKQMIERCLELYPTHNAAREMWKNLQTNGGGRRISSRFNGPRRKV